MRYLLGMSGYMRQTLQMYENGYTLERLVGLQTLMQQVMHLKTPLSTLRNFCILHVCHHQTTAALLSSPPIQLFLSLMFQLCMFNCWILLLLAAASEPGGGSDGWRVHDAAADPLGAADH
jgi:hypothetical protein